MNYTELTEQIFKKKSMLCVGLDTDLAKIPPHIKALDEPIFAFNRSIIDATEKTAIAYKLNTAFYEAEGLAGLQAMKKTVAYLKSEYPKIFIIADAKRGDIGSTSQRYATAYFSHYRFDSITLSPYMGQDSIRPYLDFEGKWSILLGITSNPGAIDFQEQRLVSGAKLYETVIQKSLLWADHQKMMYVVGATRTDTLAKIRSMLPKHFLLVPGIGAQGGSLKEVCKKGATPFGGLLINIGRSIIYAGNDGDFSSKAGQQAADFVAEMQKLPPFSSQ